MRTKTRTAARGRRCCCSNPNPDPNPKPNPHPHPSPHPSPHPHPHPKSSPWQAVLLLNSPHDFEGGALYVLDAAERPPRLDTKGDLVCATPNQLELPFSAAGDAVVFAANSTAFGGRRHLYHGMTRVTYGRRFAVGLFQ